MNHYLSTVFCDDIRYEIGSKFSLIGIYSGNLIVPAFPVKLPKLCIAATLVISADNPPKTIILRVLKDEEPIAELNATEGYLKQIASAKTIMPEPSGTQRVHSVRTEICFEQLEFTKPGFLRVSASADSGEIRSVGLQVIAQADLTRA